MATRSVPVGRVSELYRTSPAGFAHVHCKPALGGPSCLAFEHRRGYVIAPTRRPFRSLVTATGPMHWESRSGTTAQGELMSVSNIASSAVQTPHAHHGHHAHRADGPSAGRSAEGGESAAGSSKASETIEQHAEQGDPTAIARAAGRPARGLRRLSRRPRRRRPPSGAPGPSSRARASRSTVTTDRRLVAGRTDPSAARRNVRPASPMSLVNTTAVPSTQAVRTWPAGRLRSAATMRTHYDVDDVAGLFDVLAGRSGRGRRRPLDGRRHPHPGRRARRPARPAAVRRLPRGARHHARPRTICAGSAPAR